jgi:hypothetical protein
MTKEVKSESEKKKEDWMNSKWRPAMGWMYMLTCVTDFVLFPILWSLAQTLLKQPITQWQPLTLQGAGLFHIAMGAVLGIAAYGRTQEKLGGANNGGINLPSSQSTTPGAAPAVTTSWGSQPLGSGSQFGGAPTAPAGFGGSATAGTTAFAPAPSWGTTPVATEVTTGWGGKKAPPPVTDFPER